jgi:RNA polymerase sigma-70 factor (ECF subfamily)
VTESPRTPPDGAELVSRFRDGDPAAFGEIVGRYRQPLYLVARRLLASHDEADEALQTALARAWRARERFRGEASLRTWLTAIVVNVARSLRAARTAERARREDGDPERVLDPGEPADERLRRQRLRARVRRAVSRLPERQREVVMLKVFSDMTYREVAEALQLTEGAVKAHLHQAVSNLRRRLVPAAPLEPQR